MGTIREMVSKEKRRYQKNGFDLDLMYITPKIIAMGFPSENMEGMFRNPMKEVQRFFEIFHKDHYKIYNLCADRKCYGIEKFHGRVSTYAFDDHNAPNFELLIDFCKDADAWIKEDGQNVIAVHCKAGKGRTGTMICAYMLYSREWREASDAIEFYDDIRTYNKKRFNYSITITIYGIFC